MLGKQIGECRRTLTTENDFGVDVPIVDLPNELPAPPAGRQHVEHIVLVAPDRHDPGDSVFAGCDHRGDRGVLSAEASTGPSIDAHADELSPDVSHEGGGHIPEEPVAYEMRIENSHRRRNQLVVRHLRHRAERTRGRRVPTAFPSRRSTVRAMADTCTHLDTIAGVTPSACLAVGGRWVYLRRCEDCGHVGCCDNSPGRHASAHWNTTQHPLIRSFEPGADWIWCVPDELFFEIEDAPPASSQS